MKPPCPPNCSERCPGCQSKCPKYRAMREEIARERAEKVKQNLLDGYCIGQVRKAQAMRARTKSGMLLTNIH